MDVRFAHLGVDLFQNKLGESLGKNVNFNTPENALCVLMQMFVGEGWNEILSLTVQQTQASAALYFCTFVLGSVLFTQVSNHCEHATLLSSLFAATDFTINELLHN